MIQQTSSKLPANLFKIHALILDVCWTFAGSCKRPIRLLYCDVNFKKSPLCLISSFNFKFQGVNPLEVDRFRYL